jgi:ubiquinone/menaquinone biosynthesis C-methylase UbiE
MNTEDESRAEKQQQKDVGIAAIVATDCPSQGSSPTGFETPIEADTPPTDNTTNLSSPIVDETTQSIIESVYQFTRENGRTYHSYRAGSYPLPNDPTETERLDFQFEMLKFAFHSKNYFAPLTSPKFILDIGTGTGQWALEMGDAFPDAIVQATDLSPIQPSSVPENVHFFIDDASEEDWVLPPNHFDYIHTRILLGCFEDFRTILKKAFYYTKPGGYMESQEFMLTPYCDDGTMPHDWPFGEWTKYVEQAAVEGDKPLKIANKLKRWYEEVGFVDVQEKIFKLPLGMWPRDPHLKELGRMWEDNCLAGLQGFSLAYFSRMLGWSKTEIEVYLVNVRKSISDRNAHVYHRVYVVWGRKPELTPPTSSSASA